MRNVHLINFFVGFACIFILTAQFGIVIVQSRGGETFVNRRPLFKALGTC